MPSERVLSARWGKVLRPERLIRQKRERRWEEIASRFNSAMGIRGLELGAYKGVNASHLLSLLPALDLTMIDAWSAGVSPSYVTSGSKDSQLSDAQFQAVYKSCLKAVDFAKERVHILRQATVDKRGVDGLFDFIFIDADHSYDGCRQDIAAWWDDVKPGGYLCGHDYGEDDKNTHKGWGVTHAVTEFSRAVNLPVMLGVDSTWFIRKPRQYDGPPLYRILSVAFPRNDVREKGGEYYRKWSMYEKTLRRSVELNAPEAEFVIENPEPPKPDVNKRWSWVANRLKLRIWREYVQKADIPLVLLDADTIVLDNLLPVWDMDFDVAVTERPHKTWINGGVVFVKPTAKARRFFDLWYEEDEHLAANMFKGTRLTTLGLNQTAFLNVYNKRKYEAKIIRIPCRIWNALVETFREFDLVSTRILHAKGGFGKRLAKSEQMPSSQRIPAWIYREYQRIAGVI